MDDNIEQQSIDLMEIFRIFRKRIAIVIIIPTLCVLTSFILSFYVIQPVYRATTTVIVGERVDQTKADQQIQYSSIMANQQLAKTYETIAKSRTVLDRVADALGSNLSAADIIGEISVSAVKDTEVIAINVNDRDPERAALIANKITNEFSKRVIEIKKVDSVSVVDAAQVPELPIKPNKKMNLLLALVLGLFVAIGLAFLLEILDNTVKLPDEVESLIGLPVLGTIPRFTE